MARSESTNPTPAPVSRPARRFEAEGSGDSEKSFRDRTHAPVGDAEKAKPASLPIIPPHADSESGHTLRWWCAVLVGAVLAFPVAWILSYVAALPFFLGLFFFPLLGLVIGAAMHRVAAPGRPYGRGVLLLGTTMVVLLTWGGSIVKEARDFPNDVATRKSLDRRRYIEDVSVFRTTLANDVRRVLREQYPPGGTLGYVRWILTDGTLAKGQVPNVERPLTRTPRQWWWGIRVVLSVGLLAFGIGSQTLALQSATEHRVRAMDEPSRS